MLTRTMTVEELERDGAPEGRWELIDGELVEMPPSGSEASNIGSVINLYLAAHVRSHRLGKTYGADGGFVVQVGAEMVRVPDVAFVRSDRLPDKQEQRGFLRLAPDLAVEVVSPTDRASDVTAKATMWLDAGTALVWVIDPMTRTVTVYAVDRTTRLLRMGDVLEGGKVLPDFRLPLAELFA